MKYIELDKLIDRLPELRKSFNSKKPFRYLSFDDFFSSNVADQILDSYPSIDSGDWDNTTYVDQKNKFQKSKFESGSILKELFDELNSQPFLTWLEQLTGMEDEILGDAELFGGGLHQSSQGAFLNVHVDYNIHPTTNYHRRLNVIFYMNKEWKDEFEGHLELWDLSNGNKQLLDKIAPVFNRCVIFETNEISYHGHPKPLKTPKGVNRKSIATYYYTKTRPGHELADSHNTVYVNTDGVSGQLKRFGSGIKAFFERLTK